MQFFAYSWKLPAYNGAFLLTVANFSYLTYNCSFFAYNYSFFTYSWSFLAYSGNVRLRRALRDCKQRSLTVSKDAPTVSKKTFPKINCPNIRCCNVLPARLQKLVGKFFLIFCRAILPGGGGSDPQNLSGLKNANANAAFFECKGPERNPWPRGKPLNRKK